MSPHLAPVDWAALATGLGAILGIYHYFFRADRGTAVAVPAGGGVPEVVVAVRGGYQPATVRVPAGRPVRLVFDRQEASGCSEEVVFGDFGVRRFLPAHQRTTVDLPAAAPGAYAFTCGMGMLRGTLVAE